MVEESRSLSHLKYLINSKAKHLADEILTYASLSNSGPEYIQYLVEQFNFCAFFYDDWSKRFIEALNVDSYAKAEALEPLLVRYNQIVIKIVSAPCLSFGQAHSYLSKPYVQNANNSKLIAIALALHKRKDCPSYFDLELVELISKERDIYSYLPIFQNHIFKEEIAFDNLVKALVDQGFNSGTRLLLLKNFVMHIQITNLHKLFFLESLSKMASLKEFTDSNELVHVYEFIKQELSSEIPEGFLGKLLW